MFKKGKTPEDAFINGKNSVPSILAQQDDTPFRRKDLKKSWEKQLAEAESGSNEIWGGYLRGLLVGLQNQPPIACKWCSEPATFAIDYIDDTTNEPAGLLACNEHTNAFKATNLAALCIPLDFLYTGAGKVE